MSDDNALLSVMDVTPTEHDDTKLTEDHQEDSSDVEDKEDYHHRQHHHQNRQRHQRHHPDDEDHDAITVVRVERPVFTHKDFIATYNKPPVGTSGSSASDGVDGSHPKELLPKTVMRHIHEQLKGRRFLRAPSCDSFKRTLLKLFPFVRIMKQYNVRSDLPNDIISGLMVGIMNIPQGMAYGMLAKLSPVCGLYVSFFPVICYFFFGTSKHISIGTFALVSLMVGQVVEKVDCGANPQQLVPFANETYTILHDSVNSGNLSELTAIKSVEQFLDSESRCQLGTAVAVTFLVGIYQIIFGLLGLGFVTTYLSDPLTRALTMAAAVHVATSQIRYMFGVDLGRHYGSFKLLLSYGTFFKNIDATNVASLLMCVVSLVLIYSSQRWLNPIVKKRLKVQLPAELIVLILTTVISHFGEFERRFKMPVVGNIPTGLPIPAFPPASRFSMVAGDAVGIAIVAFAISISMAKMFAKKHNYVVDPNQELLAYGITNSVCSMLNCYASTASLSRSFIQEASGGRTQVAGLVSSCLLLVVLLAISPLFYSLPKCILAAIVLVNLKGVLLQILDIKELYKSRQYFDLMIWIVTALSVILTDVDTGLYLGVAFSLMTVIFRTQRPRTYILGRIPHTDLYEDLKSYPMAREIPGIKIFRYGSSLYYANAEHFSNHLVKKTCCDPEKMKRDQQNENKIQTTVVDNCSESPDCRSDKHRQAFVSSNEAVVIYDIILDFSSVIFIDTVGVSTMQQILKEFKSTGVRIHIACCKDDVYDKLERAGTFKKADNCTVFLGVHDAVLSIVESNDCLLNLLRSDSKGVLGSVFNVNVTDELLSWSYTSPQSSIVNK